MKKILLLLLFIPLISFGQTDKKNVFEASYLKVRYGMDLAFEKAVKIHIKSFYNSDVYSYFGRVTHGHRAGDYLWIKGPMKMSFLDKNNKKRKEDWKNNVLSKSEITDSNLYRNHPEYSSLSDSNSGSGKIAFVRGFRHKNQKTTFHILNRLKEMSDIANGCNPYFIVTPIAKLEGEPDFFIVRHLSSMGEFDEDDIFDKKNCNIGEKFQSEMSKEEREGISKMWGDNFELVLSHFRIRIE